MNAGLTNLATVRNHLLAGSLAGDKRFDAVIQNIGLAVAGLFDTFCNRKLAWLEGDTIQFSGARPHYYLPRYPVATVSAVQMKYFRTDQWTDISDQPISVNYEQGLLHFGYTLGRDPLQVKVTYTGGFWFEMNDEGEDPYPSTQPDVSADSDAPEQRKFLLPGNLRGAFLLQCSDIWDRLDVLGTGLVDKPGAQSDLRSLEMSPMVKQMLQPFIRYQLS